MIADGPCSYVAPSWDLVLWRLAREIASLPLKADRRAAVAAYATKVGAAVDEEYAAAASDAAGRRLAKLVRMIWDQRRGK